MKTPYQKIEIEIIPFEREDMLTDSKEYNYPDIPIP